MMLEGCRILADWLARADHGVNALLGGIPRDAADPAPPIVQKIADESRDRDVAQGQLPEALPCLAVFSNKVLELDGHVMTADADAKISSRSATA